MEAQRNVAVRWARPGDEPALLQLLIDAYGRWPRVETRADPLDHLIWKHENIGVQSGRSAIAVAGDTVVGAIPLSTRTFIVDGRPLQAATAWDVAVHPAYRRFGIMMDLQRFSRGEYRNGLDFNFGYEAPHPAMVRGREKIGNWSVMTHQTDELVANVSLLPSPRTVQDVTIDIAERVDERFDALCQEATRPFRLAGLRDQRYLTWRYCDPRGGGATLLVARHGNELLGFAALRVSNGTGYLPDLLVLPGRNDIAGALASEGLRRLAASGVAKAQCWLPALHPYREALVAAGFSRVKRTRAFTYEVLQAPEADLSFLAGSEAQVHIMIGDTDLV